MVEKIDSERYQADAIEELAAREHERWGNWHHWLEQLATPLDVQTFVPEWGQHETRRIGYLIPARDFDRWTRQAATPYSELTPEEQELDRSEVRELVELLQGPETAQDGAGDEDELSSDLIEFRDRLRALFASMTDLLVSKRQAYGTNNLIRHGHKGISVRMSDKIDRLDNLTGAGKEVSADNESVMDAYRDLIGYAALGILLWEDDHKSNFTVTLDFEPLMKFAQSLGDMLSIAPTPPTPRGRTIQAASDQEAEATEREMPVNWTP